MDLERISDLFNENFSRFGELGASLSLIRHGEHLIDLAGGHCDREKKVQWTRKTPALIWSATKGLASACLIHTAHTHGIGLDRKVADFWPEYSAAGKAETTLLQVLTHQAGQPALRSRAISILDHEAVAAQLARQEPFWKPGDAHGYHPRTYGFLLDELIRRITQGTPLGTYFRAIFGEPLELDLWIGIPDSILNEVAPIFAPRKERELNDEDASFYKALSQPDSLTRRAFLTPAGLHSPSQMNDPKVRQHSLPSLGGIGTAESLARFYDSLCLKELLPSEMLERIATLQCSGPDQVLRVDTAFGIGYMKDPVVSGKKTRELFGASLTGFGQPGSGGSLGFCDPENGIAFGYVMNQMEPGLFPNMKSLRIVKHFYDRCL